MVGLGVQSPISKGFFLLVGMSDATLLGLLIMKMCHGMHQPLERQMLLFRLVHPWVLMIQWHLPISLLVISLDENTDGTYSKLLDLWAKQLIVLDPHLILAS